MNICEEYTLYNTADGTLVPLYTYTWQYGNEYVMTLSYTELHYEGVRIPFENFPVNSLPTFDYLSSVADDVVSKLDAESVANTDNIIKLSIKKQTEVVTND